MTPPPTTTQKVKKESFKAETKCKKISRVRFPNEIATPTRVRCGGNPGILQEGSRGGVWSADPASHVDSLPYVPRPGFGQPARARGPALKLKAADHRAPSPARARAGGQREPRPRRRWRTGSAHIATLKQSKSQPSPTSRDPPARLGGARPRSLESGPGSPPHIRGPRPKFTRVARGSARALLLPAQPSRPGRTGTPRRARPAPRGAQAATWRGLPGLLEQLPGGRFPPSSPGSRPLRDAPSGRSLPREKLLTPLGAVLASAPHPRQPTLRLNRAPGAPPRGAPILLGTKMSRRVTGRPPPRPTPRAGRTRCLRAARPGDSPSARPPRRGG